MAVKGCRLIKVLPYLQDNQGGIKGGEGRVEGCRILTSLSRYFFLPGTLCYRWRDLLNVYREAELHVMTSMTVLMELHDRIYFLPHRCLEAVKT